VSEGTPMGSPKGNIQLHPACGQTDDGQPAPRPRLNDDLELARRVAIKLAFHVSRTPSEFVDEGLEEEQRWSVMPDVVSQSNDYVPNSKHPTRDDAVRTMKRLNEEKAAEKQTEANEKTESAALSERDREGAKKRGRWQQLTTAAQEAWNRRNRS
jgi:hypothetical protein